MSASIDDEWEPTRNRVLASLTPGDRSELMFAVQRVQLEPRQVLVLQGEPVRHVYFLLRGLSALTVVMREGRTALAGIVGNEGVVGISAILGPERSPVEVVSHSRGAALRVSAAAVRQEFGTRPGVRDAIVGYASLLLALTQRNAACNCLHDAGPRLARWLLVASDRIETPNLAITQELLGAILGVRRATVSTAAEGLQALGSIRYRRGQVAIVDRPRLESAACECYRATQGQFGNW